MSLLIVQLRMTLMICSIAGPVLQAYILILSWRGTDFAVVCTGF